MFRNSLFIFLFILSSFLSVGQISNSNTYEFLQLGSSARSSALGGNHAVFHNPSSGQVMYNPALLDSTMNNTLNLNYVNYIADINYGQVGYSFIFNKKTKAYISCQYFDYGSFVEANEEGLILGDFSASEMAVSISAQRKFNNRIKYGASFKLLYSSLESYSSYGLAMDLAINYISSDKLFSAAVVAQNIGFQLKSYTRNNREDLPSSFKIGVSKKLKHAPFIFNLTYLHLENQKLNYRNQKNHFILGVELSPSKNISLRGGYNLKRRNDLVIETKKSTVGFSWGIGLKLSRFQISYGSSSYHLSGASNIFSISSKLSSKK